jgi:endo-1,4-beta-mannosidase
MAQYLNWNEAGDIPYPPPQPGGDWTEYQAYTAGFFSNQNAIDDYKSHIDYLINRINPYTGLVYKDDPTIMTWELANEPRGMTNANNFNLWIDNAAAFIKALDTNHLVTTGCEGDTPWPSWNGLDFVSNHNGPNIDYATIHIWPQNWGWYDPAVPGTYSFAENEARTYFNEQIAKAASLNNPKPAVLEEFGLARDGGSYDPITATIQRDLFFTAMYEEVYDSANSGGPAAGTNFWAWSGEGRPLEPYGSDWSPGDPWTGDPPHEVQGWYSVYDADSTTLAVISDHSSEMNSLIDADDDGVPDDTDNCPAIPNGPDNGTCSAGTIGDPCTSHGNCGCQGFCSIDQEDVDGDGFGDICDNCPDDPAKTEPGVCGCGFPETDSDTDGIPDCNDACPNDPNNDADGDGVCGDVDGCPNDPNNDIDSDGHCAAEDNCPNKCNVDQWDADGDGTGDVCDPDPGCGKCDQPQCESECLL